MAKHLAVIRIFSWEILRKTELIPQPGSTAHRRKRNFRYVTSSENVPVDLNPNLGGQGINDMEIY